MVGTETSRVLVPPLTLRIENGRFPDGKVTIDPPVVLAPMAGITNSAFRTLCREQGAGLFVSEMVTARALVERNEETMRMIVPGKDESPRSIQLYATEGDSLAKAIEMLGREDRADHIDLNFGCPVPKVTRKGGGAALPYKKLLFQEIVTSAVKSAKPFGIPVTIKMRIGIDDDHQTFLTAAEIAADAGVAWVALHARTAAQYYDGEADWSKIKELVDFLKPWAIPVLGNGDIWSGNDGLRMIEETGCHGVVVGRGCLGRPWLFADLVRAFTGRQARPLPTLSEVSAVIYRHAELLTDYFDDEFRACRDLRKHMAWYLKGFRVEGGLRPQFGMVASLSELRSLLDQLVDQPYPEAIGDAPRGRRSHARAVSLPQGWLDDAMEAREDLVGAMSGSEDDAGSGG
jgi:nifR3 family TIM-barrel protein